MATGIVKFYREDKGYGFLQLPNSNSDVFFHVTALQQHEVLPQPGDQVEFEMGQGPKGRCAKNVRLF